MKGEKTDCDPNTTVLSQQLEHRLDSCDPLECVLFSQSPSVHVYFALRSRLESSSDSWLQEFVELDGLESLLNSLSHMTSPELNGFSDAILQMDCLSCIRAVINTRVGMEALIFGHSGVEKLLRGANLANTLPRKHVFEMLSAVCVYSSMGYTKLMTAMETFQHENHLCHKFSFIVNELKLAETIPHKKSVLTFINAVLCSTEDKALRMRLRSQFIGLGLLDVLSFLQKEDSDEDLYVQLQVFQDRKHQDEMSINTEGNVDLNSPQDLADMIQSQVFGGPKMVCFVNILQDLLAIETSKKEKSNSIWQMLEQHVYHVVHVVDDVTKLHGLNADHTCSTLIDSVDADAKTFEAFYTKPPGRSVSQNIKDMQTGEGQNESKKPGRIDCSSSISKKRVSCADSGFIGCEEKFSPQVEKRLKSMPATESAVFNIRSEECVISETMETDDQEGRAEPVPTIVCDNMNNDDEVCEKQTRKHLSVYDNISPTKICNRKETNTSSACSDCLNNLNLRSGPCPPSGNHHKDVDSFHLNVTGSNHRTSDSSAANSDERLLADQKEFGEELQCPCPSAVMRNLKWIKIDEATRDEFPHCVWLSRDAGKLRVKPDFDLVEDLFRERNDWKMTETPLLSMDCRLKINLFLNRCDEEPTELVKRLVRVDGPAFPLAFIKHLMDVLPEYDEIKHLKFYNGSLLDLGQAEQFVLHLCDVPDYRTVLGGQLRRSELCFIASRLRSVLTCMLESSRTVLSHQGLAEVLCLILQLGNFLNYSQFNGYAGGFKLSSLRRLMDVKSYQANCSLIHFTIELAEKTDENLLSFLNEIPRLKTAASCSLLDIKADFDRLNSQINTFVKQLASANPIIRNGFNRFLDEVKSKFKELQCLITELKTQSRRLAAYFCESESFDLQACFQDLLRFFEDLKKHQEELKLMSKQRLLARKQTNVMSQRILSRHMSDHFGLMAGACSSVMEEKKRLVDGILTDLNRANFKPALRSQCGLQHEYDEVSDEPSPTAQAEPREQKEPHTPDREKEPMDLSRISLVGTPMINRPGSDDEEPTIMEKPKFATSSENNLLDDKLIGLEKRPKIPPILALPDQLTPGRGKSHYRSRSDLADSNIHSKWIRYHDQLKQVRAPVATPESSITLATLNLEARGLHRYGHLQHEPIASLVSGPTVTLPSTGRATTGRDNGDEKKLDRKSALSNFLTRISRRVLKPRNGVGGGVDNAAFATAAGEDRGGGTKAENKRQAKIEKNVSKSSSTGKIKDSEVEFPQVSSSNQYDKENVAAQLGNNGPFDRQKKNPIRLSNRFRSKFGKS